MKNYLTPLLLLVCGVLLLGGCVNTGAVVVTGLRVELTGIERAGNGSILVSWRVVNTNITPYLLARVSHKIYLNGTLAGTTLDTDPMGVPAQAHAAKSTKLTLASPAVKRILTEAAAQGSASYRVDSILTIQIYADADEKGELTNSGSVKVTSK
jgi:hypothetical protein